MSALDLEQRGHGNSWDSIALLALTIETGNAPLRQRKPVSQFFRKMSKPGVRFCIPNFWVLAGPGRYVWPSPKRV
jgi:hypothetical protein